MYALKFAHLVKEKTSAEVYQFYIDMRAFGKGYEEFYQRILDEGVNVIRGKGAEVVPASQSAKSRRRTARPLRGHADRQVPRDPGRHGRPLHRAGGTRRRQGDGAQVQHLDRRRWLVYRSASQAGSGIHDHRRDLPGRRLPGCKGHSRLRRTGAAAAAQVMRLLCQGEVVMDAAYAEIKEELCSRLPNLQRSLSVHAIDFDRREEDQPRQLGAVQGLRHLRRRPVRRARSRAATSPMNRSTRRSRGYCHELRTENRRLSLQLVQLYRRRSGRHCADAVSAQCDQHPRDVLRSGRSRHLSSTPSGAAPTAC